MSSFGGSFVSDINSFLRIDGLIIPAALSATDDSINFLLSIHKYVLIKNQNNIKYQTLNLKLHFPSWPIFTIKIFIRCFIVSYFHGNRVILDFLFRPQ